MGNGHRTPPILLTIAGFDPSCGAGVAADLKTFAAHNCYGVAAVSALTVQSTQGVVSVHATPAATLRAQLDALAEDAAIAGVKIGMLANRLGFQDEAPLCYYDITRFKPIHDRVEAVCYGAHTDLVECKTSFAVFHGNEYELPFPN